MNITFIIEYIKLKKYMNTLIKYFKKIYYILIYKKIE